MSWWQCGLLEFTNFQLSRYLLQQLSSLMRTIGTSKTLFFSSKEFFFDLVGPNLTKATIPFNPRCVLKICLKPCSSWKSPIKQGLSFHLSFHHSVLQSSCLQDFLKSTHQFFLKLGMVVECCVQIVLKNGKNGPKIALKNFFELYKIFFRSFNLLDWSEMKVLIIYYVTVEFPNVGKIWFLRYGLKYF